MIGYGRVEVVTSAWHAFRIVEELNKYELFNDNAAFDDIDILEIADFITNRNYTRSFDSRIKLKEDLVKLTNTFFKNKAVINNPMYYATLYDMWSYVNDIRRSGSAISFGIEPRLDYRLIKREDVTDEFFSYKIFALVRFEYYRALNMKWQFDFKTEFKSGIEEDKDLRTDEVDDTMVLGVSTTSLGLSYYPNTRTSFKSLLNIFGSMEGYFDNDNINSDGRISLKNNMYYYMSPQTRLSIYFNIGDEIDYRTIYGKDYTVKDFTVSYGVGFNHYIF